MIHRRSTALLTLLGPLYLVPSCSGSSSESTVTNDQAAADTASAFCSRVDACAPAFISLLYGDVATCTSKFKTTIMGSLTATGTSANPTDMEACAQALPGASCEDVLGRNLPAPCKAKPGTLPDGAACGDDAQCVGRLCNIAPGQICGVCSAPVAAGGACRSDDDCDTSLKCAGMANQLVCTARVAAGGACDASHPCQALLACKAGTCATPDPAGTACMTGQDTCDSAHGVLCHPVNQTCAQLTFAKPGDACGLVGGGIALCQSGGLSPTPACSGLSAATMFMGTCQAPAADGAMCNDMTGPRCVSPSICVSGACKIKDASGCR